MLVLALGDLHIPLRTHDLPSKFKKLLVPGKIQQIVCTGNVCDRETWEYLRGVAPDVRGVRGDYDENPALPPSLVLQHGPLRIGVLHGHQVVPLGDTEALSAVARKMDVDVLITGGTHRFEAFEYDSRFFVNPGSATGAFSPHWTPSPPTAPKPSTLDVSAAPSSPKPPAEGETPAAAPPPAAAAEPAPTTTTTVSSYPPNPIPSFALLDIQGTVVTLYVYQLIEGEVKVEKISFRKNA
ncbi:hypothetical protein MNV49_006119 [Pseudohyphozyma bogoriensis]|nr:hypothetical protein MNV49_006119 [Pseudohyphozyma bogoriensis]